jgi:hypothetical protein
VCFQVEGKPIVPMNVCTSVEQIRQPADPDLMISHPRLASRQPVNTLPQAIHRLRCRADERGARDAAPCVQPIRP